MDAEVGGTPFSVLIERAARLKTARDRPLRSRYDSFPAFLRNSMFPRERVTEARAAPTFEGRADAAEALKGEGNDMYREGEYRDAAGRYEMAIAVFRYLENSNPNWKTEGIRDDDISEVAYVPRSPAEERRVSSILVSCYTNLALAFIGYADHRSALDACDAALEVDGTCAKALYLRARARITPVGSGAAERDTAMADLERAAGADPDNGAVRKELQRLRRDVRSQRRRDRERFRGLFERGEIYAEDAPAAPSVDGGGGGGGRPASPSGGGPGRRTCTLREAGVMADLCARRGLTEEERALRREIEMAEEGAAAERRVDFDNPSEEMREEAGRMGVDLSDPRVLAALRRLRSERTGNRGGGGEGPLPDEDTARGGGASGAIRKWARRTRSALRMPPEDVPIGGNLKQRWSRHLRDALKPPYAPALIVLCAYCIRFALALFAQ